MWHPDPPAVASGVSLSSRRLASSAVHRLMPGEDDVSTVTIIGGGFSGTVTAVHLLRQRSATVRRVILINRSGAMARGVAYGTRSDHHVLNVPAGRMSAFDDDPDSFVRFVLARGVHADGGTFVSRHLYGSYLEWLLRDAADRAAGITFERLTADVLRIETRADGTGAVVVLRDGARIPSDRVVLAAGNYAPTDPAMADESFFHTSPRYVRDPWVPGALAAAIDPQLPTLLIGSGLTMIDMVLDLQTLGARGGCLAVSRRGLLPMAHRSSAAHAPSPIDLPSGLLDGPRTVRAYLRTVRRHIRAASQQDMDWRDVVTSLRPWTAQLWQALSMDERRRFLRHVRPFWEVHRHRAAPQPHEAFTRLLEAGDVRILAGRLQSIQEDEAGIVVRFTPRASHDTVALRIGAIVNCTGPAGDSRKVRDMLFESLLAQGVLTPDALGLGIETSPTGALVGQDGRVSPTLYYVGPFFRARDWEATAVPELRQYACQLAEHLVQSLASTPSPMQARAR